MPSCGGRATLNVPFPARTDAGLPLCVGSECTPLCWLHGCGVNQGNACLQLFGVGMALWGSDVVSGTFMAGPCSGCFSSGAVELSLRRID